MSRLNRLRQVVSYSLFALFCISVLLSLGACSKDKEEIVKPTSLVNFEPTINIQQQWKESVGMGESSAYLKLAPAIFDGTVFIAGSGGKVKAINANSGKVFWQSDTKVSLSSGLGANEDMLFVGTADGRVLALQQKNGQVMWQARVIGDVLAAPAANKSVVVVKTESGHVSVFQAQTGKTLWTYAHQEPGLILRGGSAPKIVENLGLDLVLCGFASGEMVAFKLDTGHIAWQQHVAVPTSSFVVERMVDIDADPVVVGNVVYAVAYQGNIAALNIKTGHVIWQKPMSSNSGLAVDAQNIYVTDTSGRLWALSKTNGEIIWYQDYLCNRGPTAPVLVAGGFIVVGDVEGYVHWIYAANGKMAGRIKASGGIAVPPLFHHHVTYVFDVNGNLIKFNR